MKKYTLKYILKEIDPKKKLQPINTTVDLDLTFSETTLLTGGSSTGFADCSLPPYVVEEADIIDYSDCYADDIPPNIVRTSILNFFLSGRELQDIVKPGSITLKGAQITPTAVHDTNKMSNTKKESQISWDVTGRHLPINIQFIDCNFTHGIKLSDASIKGLILDKCNIGISEDGKSIIATNCRITDDFVIKEQRKEISHKIERSQYNIQGSIALDKSKIGGSLQLDELSIRGGMSMQHIRVNDHISFYKTKIFGKSDKEHSIISIDGYDLTCDNLYLTEMIAHTTINIVFAKVKGLLACVGSKLYGKPYSLQAAGVSANAIFLREGFFALHGVNLRKSTIESDLDCSEAFFGSSLGESEDGQALIFTASKAKNVLLNNGFVSIGYVSLFQAEIDFLRLNQSIFIHPLETAQYSNFALDGSYAVINRAISFNPSRVNSRSSETYFHLMFFNFWIGFDHNLYSEKLKDVRENLRSALDKLDKLKKLKTDLFNLANFVTDDLAWQRSYSKFKAVVRSLFETPDGNTAIQDGKLLELMKNLEESVEKDDSVENRRALIQALTTNTNELFTHIYENITSILTTIINEMTNPEPPAAEGTNKPEKSISEALPYPIILLKCFLRVFNWYKSRIDNTFVQLSDIDRYAIMIGGATFERATVKGVFDAAGGIFFREGVKSTVFERRNVFNQSIRPILPCEPALVICHASISSTLFLNRGDAVNNLPFLAHGEVDLQYTSIQTLSITPALATHKGTTRWNLIGTVYKSIESLEDGFQDPNLKSIHPGSPQAPIAKNPIKRFLQFMLRIFRKLKGIIKPGPALPDVLNGRWIYPYYGRYGFRQPYQQLTTDLFNDGDDVSARKLIVHRSPSKNLWEFFAMVPIRLFFAMAFPLQRSIAVLLLSYFAGVFIFEKANQNELLIKLPTFAGSVAPVKEPINSVSEIKRPQEIPYKLYFDKWAYSFQKLLPLIDGEQERNFITTYTSTTFLTKSFYIFYNFYPVLGTYLVAMTIIGLARVRKNG